MLLNSKRKTLAEVKAKIGANAEAQAAIRQRREPIKGKFEKLCKTDAKAAGGKKGDGGGGRLSLERFCQVSVLPSLYFQLTVTSI